MVITSETTLPTDEELTVTEINLSGAALRAGAFHMGKHCEKQNNVRTQSCFVTNIIVLHLLPVFVCMRRRPLWMLRSFRGRVFFPYKLSLRIHKSCYVICCSPQS